MATLTKIHTRLVEFVGAINGIESALKDFPLTRVFDNPLPAAIVEITDAPARYENTGGAGLCFVTRRFRVFLAIATAEANATAPNATQLALCETLIERVARAFLSKPRLECRVMVGDPPLPVLRLPLVYSTTLVSDEGISAYEIARLRVWGTVFTVDVTDEVNYWQE